jgi:ABC-type transport system substrate-binding protein
MFPNSTVNTAMGTIVTSQLQAAGFKVKTKTGEVNSLYNSVLGSNPTFQAFAMYGNTGLFGYDPDIWYRWLYYGSPGTFLNVTAAEQAPISKAIDDAATIDASDRDAQKKAYFGLQDMLTEACEMVHIDCRDNLEGWSNSLEDYSISIDNIPDLNSVKWK